MKTLSLRLVLPVLLVIAALLAPSGAVAARGDNAQRNDDFSKPTAINGTGGTTQGYTFDATMSNGEFHWANQGGQWGWDMWYVWTAPIAGVVRVDLCQTNPVNDEWYMAAARDDDTWPSPLNWVVGATIGCANASMPQADLTVTPGTKYRFAIGSKYFQNIFTYLRVSYVPQLAAVPTLIGSASLGQTLKANAPTWTTDAAQHTLTGPRWMSCAADGTACAAIPDASGDTYVVREADVARTIHVEYNAANFAGSVDTRSAATARIAEKPVDADGDGIPDELTLALNLPAGQAGIDALCKTYGLCKNDKAQAPAFKEINDLDILNGKILDMLLGTSRNEMLIADQDPDNPKLPEGCDGAGGNDICIGSGGTDRCLAYIGDDFCFGNKGNDTCISKAGNDVCYGGEGIDKCLVQPIGAPRGITFPPVPSVACFGNSGKDSCLVNVPAPLNIAVPWLPQFSCSGGTQNDTCKAAAVRLVKGLKITKAGVLRMTCTGDGGNDTCGVGSAPSKYMNLVKAACSGGTGNDLCVAGGASDWTEGKFAAYNSNMVCTGGPGNDTMWTLNGKGGDRINGGGHKGDYCFADTSDTVTGCGQTLRWRVSPDDLALINGTKEQRASFVLKSVATLNGKALQEAERAQMLAKMEGLTNELERQQQNQVDSIRNAIASMLKVAETAKPAGHR